MSLMDAIFADALGGGSDVPVSEGGAGWTETKVVEILPKTVCPFEDDGLYHIPCPDMDADCKYNLYVNGEKMFYSDFDMDGLNWIRFDPADSRFQGYYSYICPDGSLDPVPETIVVSITQVLTIVHPVADKYLQNLPVRVGLLETGGVLVEKQEIPVEVDNGAGFGISYILDTQTIELLTSVLTPGTRTKVHFDGAEYVCDVKEEVVSSYIFFGDPELTAEPFCVAMYDDGGIIIAARGTEKTHTVGLAIDYAIPNYIAEDKVLCSVGLEEWDGGSWASTDPINLVVGKSYLVILDSRSYMAVCKRFNNGSEVYLGNLSLSTYSGAEDTGESFYITNSTYIVDQNGGRSCTVVDMGAGPSIIDPNRLVKTIDLDSYGIGEAILTLFANGGGTEVLTDMRGFWHDVSTKSMLRLEMNYSSFHFVIDQCVRMFSDGHAVQLAYNFMVTDEEGVSHLINISIINRGWSAGIVVKVS